jgi:hypothetical protein
MIHKNITRKSGKLKAPVTAHVSEPNHPENLIDCMAHITENLFEAGSVYRDIRFPASVAP